MSEFHSQFVGNRLFKFGIKGLGISGQDASNRRLTILLVTFRILTNCAPTIDSTVNLNGKALTIQLEAFGLFACTSHGGNFFSMRRLNLTRACSSFPI
jgi:hypothetical protein